MPDLKKALKKIYKTIPFKRRLFSLLKKVWSPPESIYQHLYFNGLIEVSINDTRHFKIMHYGYRLENEFFWKGLYGSWEKHSIKLWVTLLKDSKVVFDIGANTGIYSLIAKTANPELGSPCI